MEARSFSSSRSSSQDPAYKKLDPLLPLASVSEKTRMRTRGIFGPCLYRRVMIWVVTSLIVVAIVLFKTQEGVYDVAVNLPGSLSHAPAAQGSGKGPSTPQQLNEQVSPSSECDMIALDM